MLALERRADVLADAALPRSPSAPSSSGSATRTRSRRCARVSVVGANYGLGHRNLGAVGVVGPRRMDYATAIASVRVAARELSHYFETVYSD